MTFTPVPKPVRKTVDQRNVERIVRAWSRTTRWRAKAIQREKGKIRKPIAPVGRTKKRRMAEYSAYLKSPAWKAFRKIVFERDGYQCVDCGEEAGYFVNGKRDIRGLECDHETYVRLFRELPEDCRTRCRRCHRQKHQGNWWKRIPPKYLTRGTPNG